MFMNRLGLAGLVCIVLAGCATQRPQLTESQYTELAGQWIVVDYCNWKGWMSPETSARGKQYINWALGRTTYNQETFENTLKSLQPEALKISQGHCNRMASSIEERKNEIDSNTVATTAERQSNQSIMNSTKPTQTYCNKIGTQVMCNSY